MPATLIRGLPMPERQFGNNGGKRGSKFDSALEVMQVGDCIKLHKKGQAGYLRKCMEKRGFKAASRIIDGYVHMWRIA
jgi:hypothetical protein